MKRKKNGSAPAPVVVTELLRLALQRERKKLNLVTVYSHDEIKRDVQHAINKNINGGNLKWSVQSPPSKSDPDPDALSSWWPPEEQAKRITTWMKTNGCLDPEDVINGACEPLAIYASRIASDMLIKQTTRPDKINSKSIHEAAAAALMKKKGNEDAQAVFGELAQRNWKKGPELWGLTKGSLLENYLYGTDEAKGKVHSAAKAATQDKSTITIPLYILTYIFDEDELNPEDMKCKGPKFESAQYSVHVVGLVFHGPTQTVLIVDPNGGLLQGGNIEFVAIPPKPRGGPASTCLSQFNLDQKQNQAKKTTRKRKRGQRA
jgi:hypothetical protein